MSVSPARYMVTQSDDSQELFFKQQPGEGRAKGGERRVQVLRVVLGLSTYLLVLVIWPIGSPCTVLCVSLLLLCYNDNTVDVLLQYLCIVFCILTLLLLSLLLYYTIYYHYHFAPPPTITSYYSYASSSSSSYYYYIFYHIY